jgi:hypothetical protein
MTEKTPTKYWRLYRVRGDGKLIQPALAEADTPEELWTIHRRRQDYKYEVSGRGLRSLGMKHRRVGL